MRLIAISSAHRRLTLMTELGRIARGQFSFDYQLIVSLQSGTVWSVEALHAGTIRARDACCRRSSSASPSRPASIEPG